MVVLLCWFSSRVILPKSYPYPFGSEVAAVSFTALIASPELYPLAGTALTAIELYILKRAKDSAPYTLVKVIN